MTTPAPRAPRTAGARAPAALSDESGLAAVEFALIAPVFLVLLFGLVVYGLHFGAWLAVNQAAAEGARASIAGMNLDERKDLAQKAAIAVLSAYGPILGSIEKCGTGQSCTIVADASSSDANLFQVTVTYDQAARNVASGLNGDDGKDSFLPLPLSNPSATVTIANGGY
ncbi:TadE/TadG family type IV pilus assembly protein [Inquilinus limosus]|uniref:TadE/TadG family type IV pilus assembly protein n=1 Tax=Inquilinus limosus TaxID=171674 RepID=UPI0006912194|nr:TadE/TadG family type IV pilus assembly protein [Inquilinus limosus]